MKTFWMSWYDAEADYRPLHAPPTEPIIGWWCTGETMDDPRRVTLVAWVKADNEDAARAALAVEWPETMTAEFRFADERSDDFRPGDRFPLEPWMEQRIA